MSRSAGPFTGAPPTIGLIAITRSRRATSASRMPGTARIGPIEITGFDGQITIVSAVRSASSTPGAGRAASAPSKRTDTTGDSARSPTNHSLHRELFGVAAVAAHGDAGAHAVVGHRHEPQAEIPRRA